MKWGGVVLMASGCVLVAFLSGVAAKHTPATAWMARYRNAEGTSCCGATDCRAAQVSLVRQTPRETTVRINGVEVVLPTMSVFPSETPESYWCSANFELPPTREITRCAFYAIGS